MVQVHHRSTTVDGYDVFYREAGSTDLPTLVLLHGYPTSSHMFRHLIPVLAERFHIVAPDHIGFGRSSAPSADEFPYTFDALADVTASFLGQLGIEKYLIYVQDYGAPIGWRLALRDPEAVVGIISQNGNAYEDGFVDSFWEPVWRYASDPTLENEAAMRPALERDAIEWQYTHGVHDVSLIDPDAWEHDIALTSRPGIDVPMLRLFADYPTNRVLYPRLHEWLREAQPPVLAIWGRNDEIFGPAGAEAFRRDVPGARVVLVEDGGHFLLESHLDEVADTILAWHAETSTS
jgi:pimeloyl-ACP methyl ester carboxylesterase